MPREKSRLSNPQPGVGPERSKGTTSAPLSPAALARLNFTNSRPSLALPRIANQPASYSRVRGDDQAVTLAHTFVEAGLGSLDLWKKTHGDCVAFLRSALDEYLKACGADELDDVAVFSLSIATDVAGGGEPDRILAFIEAETAGDLRVGPALTMMENAKPGLGRDLYLVLVASLNEWMSPYDLTDAEYLVERWKESLECDMDPEREETVEQYCQRNDIRLPDVEGDTPSFLRDLDYQEGDEAAARLKQYHGLKFKAAVEDVLNLWSIKRGLPSKSNLETAWEAGPLPGWVVSFEESDAIMQCFDEESNSFLEFSHSPSWLAEIDPLDLAQLRRVLEDIRRFVKVNLIVGNIQRLFQGMEEVKRGVSRQHRKRGQLCA